MSLNTVNTGRTAARYRAVTPDDDENLPDSICMALYVGTAGDLTLVDEGGEVVVFANAPVGYHPLRASRVKATGTTATDIVALY